MASKTIAGRCVTRKSHQAVDATDCWLELDNAQRIPTDPPAGSRSIEQLATAWNVAYKTAQCRARSLCRSGVLKAHKILMHGKLMTFYTVSSAS